MASWRYLSGASDPVGCVPPSNASAEQLVRMCYSPTQALRLGFLCCARPALPRASPPTATSDLPSNQTSMSAQAPIKRAPKPQGSETAPPGTLARKTKKLRTRDPRRAALGIPRTTRTRRKRHVRASGLRRFRATPTERLGPTESVGCAPTPLLRLHPCGLASLFNTCCRYCFLSSLTDCQLATIDERN